MENQENIVFLNGLLANQHVLYIKTRNSHWNIIGPDFKSVHVFFEDLYKKFEEDIDSIAERVRKLNSPVIANMQFFVDYATLESVEPSSNDSQTLIGFIYNDLFKINLSIKEQLVKMSEDLTTINFLTTLAEENEKTLWFLKAHLD